MDEFFAANKETSSEEGDLPSSAVASDKEEASPLRHGENSTEKLMSNMQVHKNNLQDEMEIAESIICGIAQYSEMDVKNVEGKKTEEGKLIIKK